jgi:hypothetical protein
MKLTSLLLLGLSSSISVAQTLQEHESNQKVLDIDFKEPQFLVELTSGDTQWVTEAEKWQLGGVRMPSVYE